MKDNKAKIYMIFSLVVLVIAVIVSGTYAYYVWTTSDSDTTKIVAGVGAATVTFDGGSDINANLRPVSDKSKGIVKNISVKGDTTGLVFNMYLDITSIDTGLKDESFRYELYKGTTKVKEATALGAAICACVGINLYKDFYEAADICVKKDIVYYPNKNNQKVYANLINKFNDVYKIQLELADKNLTTHMWKAVGE